MYSFFSSFAALLVLQGALLCSYLSLWNGENQSIKAWNNI